MTLIVTSGEPAGIGPDIIVKTAAHTELDAVVIADKALLQSRADLLGLTLKMVDYEGEPLLAQKGVLQILHTPLKKEVTPGNASPDNAEYILSQLNGATRYCLDNTFRAMVTLPVCKATINQSGYPFSGHTEYLANLSKTNEVVMMLACDTMRVALLTTHLPLSDVPKAISKDKITTTLRILLASLETQFGIDSPRVWVAGLNPHAGEEGYLGREEIEVIAPALQAFSSSGVKGPFPADTLFSQDNCKRVDAFLAMYHDQGLCVLKYASFGDAVNITLGLPFIRTSVDHGTAFSIAGTGKAKESSFMMAYHQAKDMANTCKSI